MERQTNISDQQLAIIKEQETDRKNAAMRADLVIASRAEGENVLDLIIENKGSGWAREIKYSSLDIQWGNILQNVSPSARIFSTDRKWTR
jgi:hypothetical protein